ncbi:MAG: DUF4339 domain-containing protein [Pedosphaera sp.]|nr:DUF4339 domain-containing protein [Pedosphaera sp.]
MYKIIGGDQREYGPVTADEIRQWIAEGRANGATQVQLEEGGDWKALASFPEFIEALAAQTPPLLTLPPQTNEESPEASLDNYIARSRTLDIGSCIARSWELLKEHFWLLVGASALVFAISLAIGFIPFVGQVASRVLSLALWGGLDWLFLKLVRGEPADIADIFAGFQVNFLQLVLGGIVTSALILLGLLLFILPGIYLMVAWLGFCPLLIMDKRLDFWPALELSRKVVTQNWWTIFGLFLLTLLIVIAGVLALGVGLFVALPLATGAMVYAYEDIFNSRSAKVS